ncbi:MAG: cytochrome P450 [Mycolicibacter algericus]|uniref:Cytochrome P450 125A7 Cyp125A7 n=3 Tax=Mycolicibacter TaxID=1073531 RepID=F5YZD9_MYCSD|nr:MULTISPECIES: cytochrome P450 [Mycolicibacter]AEF36803.1 cytochrome P450 125A7 Cyp125A7 [Mycolicibacter sinensis]OQZ99467.1 steroid C27-monooxygenase [Mycolicibacter algericus DSM 45454]GFG85912.1 cytochrome P450 [Mycolicibacter algericus]
MTETPHLLPEGFDFTDPALIGERIPHEEFALLRRTEPIWWNAQPFGVSGYPDEGYWVVTKHADVRAVSLQDDVFSSHENTSLIRTNTTSNQDLHEASRDNIMLFLDGPKHAKLRRIVSRGFTPRVVAGMRDSLDRQAREIVAAAAEHDTGDFVTEVASRLPLATICELIGVPAAERQQVFDWSNRLVGGGNGDPQAAADGMQASAELLGYAYQMAEDRKARPRDDIATALVTATIDGEALTALEFGYYVMMLMVAGNETTRNATSQGMVAFFDHPDQWRLFVAERPATMVDEVVRWATPVISFQRTALRDVELGGVHIAKGQRVGMFYGSANYDEEVFDEPFTFDIRRSPNPHLGFGAPGAHYCIGANLARMQINLIFGALADIMPDIRRLDRASRSVLPWINGIDAMPVEFGGAAMSTGSR